MSDPRPIQANTITDVQYYEYECAECGGTARNTYCEPHRANMLERQLCYHCNHWRDFALRLERHHRYMTIIAGDVYGPGNRTEGSFRGMAGRRFDIEYVEPSVFAGKRITTFDLWSGSTMPETLSTRFCDTAKFLGDAARHQVGETGCWNPSDGKAEAYPLPRSLAGLK